MSESVSEVARTQWMRETGGPLFEKWTYAMMGPTDASYLAGVTEQAAQAPDIAIDPVINQYVDDLKRSDRERGVTEEILRPHQDELRRFTSLGYFEKFHTNKGDPLTLFSHDSLRFAIGISAGLVCDTLVEQTGAPGERPLDDLYAQNQLTPESLQHMLGDLGDEAIAGQLSKNAAPGRALYRSYALQKMAFVGRTLAYESSASDAIARVSKAGFGVLTGYPGKVVDQIPQDEPGWQQRAHFLHLPKHGSPVAAVRKDVEGQWTVRPEVTAYLQSTLLSQNGETGFTEVASVGGSIGSLESRRTLGCPVAKRYEHPLSAIELTAHLTGQVLLAASQG